MEKKMRKPLLFFTAIIMTLLLTMSLVACNHDSKVTITLDKPTVNMDVGEEVKLNAVVKGLDDFEVVWSSSNEEVATVAGGTVTAVAVGNATITAKVGDESATCLVTVKSNIYPTVTLSQNELELRLGGQPIAVTATVRYEGKVVTSDISWESNNKAIATVSNGQVTAVSVGTAKITASTVYNGNYAEKVLNVTVKPDMLIQVDQESLTLYTHALDEDSKTSAVVNAQVRINGEGLTSAQVDCTSSDANQEVITVATQANAITITAVKEGSATITLTYTHEGTLLSNKIEVTVERPIIVTGDTFTVNIFDSRSENVALDLSGYTWADEVKALYVGEDKVSSDEHPTHLSSEWLSAQAPGTEKELILSMGTYEAKATLKLENEFRNIKSSFAEGGLGYGKVCADYTGDETALGFESGTNAIRYNTGGQTAWNARIKTADLSSYDWWIFDVSIPKLLTQPLASYTLIHVSSI